MVQEGRFVQEIFIFIMEMDMKGRSALWKPVRILNMTLLR